MKYILSNEIFSDSFKKEKSACVHKKKIKSDELKLKYVVCSHLSPFTHPPVGKDLISVHLAFLELGTGRCSG